MIFEIGIYRLDVDVERTKAFYAGSYDIGCACDGCLNFEKAVHYLPEDVKSFFQQFGIAPTKPAEIGSPFSINDKDTAQYNGFYHLCGTILEGTNPWIKVSKKQYHLDEQYAINLSNNFSFFFTEDCLLLEEDFPSPAIQLEFTGDLPWVLDKPNPYII